MRILRLILAMSLIGVLATGNASELGKVKRLILKDGSYELVLDYQAKDGRVRYLSAERHEWEEIPYAEIDWPATEKYAREAASGAKQLEQAAAGERAEDDLRAPLVSPGIRLPAAGGVFLLDLFQSRPELNPLSQNGADVNKNMAGNILRAVINPVASSKQTIELKGAHAAIQAHATSPTIYLSIDSGGDPSAAYTPENAKDHFRIVRCEEKKGNRVVGVINIAIYGKVKQQAKYIETRVEPMSGQWVKISPAAPLEPGEYALVELLGKDGMNEFVWDFGVNPSAPANTGTIEALPDQGKPVLLQKPKTRKP